MVTFKHMKKNTQVVKSANSSGAGISKPMNRRVGTFSVFKGDILINIIP